MPDAPATAVLLVNVGSSSLKSALVDARGRRLWSARFDRLGSPSGRWEVRFADGEKQFGQRFFRNAAEAFPLLCDWIPSSDAVAVAVAHRIVHGGEVFPDHAVLTARDLAGLSELAPLAPEHLPAQIACLKAAMEVLPDVPQVGCFDTVFHRSLPPAARAFPLPKKFLDQHVRRYGFHGLAYDHLRHVLRSRSLGGGRCVLAHLGNGASMAAMADGVCVDTTMGFTPAGGLVMGTRAGDIDPGLVAYLCRLEGWDFQQFDRVVNHESGLLGLSGRSADVRELLQAADADPSAALALEVFCHVARKNLCALAGSLGGLDRVVFSGGIGENSPAIRSGICAGLDFLGIRLDPAANAKNQPTISSATSQVPVDVISADEEETMTRITATLLPDLSTLSHHTLTPH